MEDKPTKAQVATALAGAIRANPPLKITYFEYSKRRWLAGREARRDGTPVLRGEDVLGSSVGFITHKVRQNLEARREAFLHAATPAIEMLEVLEVEIAELRELYAAHEQRAAAIESPASEEEATERRASEAKTPEALVRARNLRERGRAARQQRSLALEARSHLAAKVAEAASIRGLLGAQWNVLCAHSAADIEAGSRLLAAAGRSAGKRKHPEGPGAVLELYRLAEAGLTPPWLTEPNPWSADRDHAQ